MAHDDRRRFRLAYETHLGAVLAYARRRTDPASAEDAAAETFAVAWRRVGDMPGDALPWLLAIARRVLANHSRGERRRLALTRRLSAERPAVAAAPEPAEIDAALARALRELDEDDRELLCLLAWERLDRAQAAAALGCTPAALRLRIMRARRRLARALDRIEADRPAVLPTTTDAPMGGRE